MALPKQLKVQTWPELRDAAMVIGLSGWMDGGDVSTGTIDRLVEALDAPAIGHIEPEDFYIYSSPGSMEIAALFRPHTRIEDGLIVEYTPPQSTFHACEPRNLVLFKGREPNLRWREYVECLLSMAETCGVRTLYFIGSVSGLVPHTREPRLSCSVSDESLRPAMEPFGVRFSNYEGPASVVTYLTQQAGLRGLAMTTLVAEIPAYIQGLNPRAIESVIRRLAAMLGLEVSLDTLRATSDVFEAKLNEALEGKDELAELIAKLEESYDNEVFDTQMGDLKRWLTERGIRLD